MSECIRCGQGPRVFEYKGEPMFCSLRCNMDHVKGLASVNARADEEKYREDPFGCRQCGKPDVDQSLDQGKWKFCSSACKGKFTSLLQSLRNDKRWSEINGWIDWDMCGDCGDPLAKAFVQTGKFKSMVYQCENDTCVVVKRRMRALS